jgi:hypothetical protein
MAPPTKHLVRIATGVAALYAARRYYRNWGTTKEECQIRLPGDQLVGDPAIQATEAVWIDASPSAVWPCLSRLGQDRGIVHGEALTDLIGFGFGFHNANGVDLEGQQLVVGDVLRLAPQGWFGGGLTFSVVATTPERSIVLRATSPNLPPAVWSFHLEPHWDDRSRLIARARVGLRHPGEVFALELARPAIVLTTRSVLRDIKRHAQRGHALSRSIPNPR